MELIDNPNAKAAIKARFKTLVTLAGQVDGLIASGPPGIGKSYGIERELERKGRKLQVVRAGLSPIGLFVKLWETRAPGYTLVIDDSDNILSMREGIDLLKAALDTNKPRRVQWNKANKSLKQMGIPQQFEYDGQIIFITNMDMRNAKPRSRQDDYDALMSRANYLDLELSTIEDKLIRCQMALEEGMLSELPLSVRGKIIEYTHAYAEHFNELSLRTLVKLGEAITQFGEWEAIAASTLMVNPPADAYRRFNDTGAGAAALEEIISNTFEEAGTVVVELFGNEHTVLKADVERVSIEKEEIYRRIETVDNFFLKVPFSKRPTPKEGGKSADNLKDYLAAQGFKIDGLSDEQAQELYDFVVTNISKFEQVNDPALQQMMSVYRLPAADWKKAILAMMTKRAIAKNA